MTNTSLRHSMAAVAFAAILILIIPGCRPGSDPRYADWKRYSDVVDGYVIMVPPSWEAEDEPMLGMRGTRLYSTEIKNPDLIRHAYFSIYVKDYEEGAAPFEERAEMLLGTLLGNLWCEISVSSDPREIQEHPAKYFDVQGDSCYDDIPLVAKVLIVEGEGKDYILFASSPEASLSSVEEDYSLMIASLKLPE